MEHERNYANLLYSEPSFLEGLGRVLDIGGTFDVYNTSPTAEESDRSAILSDWYAVGADLYRAIRRFAVTQGESKGDHGQVE